MVHGALAGVKILSSSSHWSCVHRSAHKHAHMSSFRVVAERALCAALGAAACALYLRLRRGPRPRFAAPPESTIRLMTRLAAGADGIWLPWPGAPWPGAQPHDAAGCRSRRGRDSAARGVAATARGGDCERISHPQLAPRAARWLAGLAMVVVFCDSVYPTHDPRPRPCRVVLQRSGVSELTVAHT